MNKINPIHNSNNALFFSNSLPMSAEAYDVRYIHLPTSENFAPQSCIKVTIS